MLSQLRKVSKTRKKSSDARTSLLPAVRLVDESDGGAGSSSGLVNGSSTSGSAVTSDNLRKTSVETEFLEAVLVSSIPLAPKLSDFDLDEKPTLASPLFLESVGVLGSSSAISLAESEKVIDTSHDDDLTPSDILLFHPICRRIVRDLPVRSLLLLAQVSRGFSSAVNIERNRDRRHTFEWLYRKEFIRYLNLSYTSQKWIREEDVFAGMIRQLYCYPEHILVFYSPDIFQYDVRIVDRNGRSGVSKPDAVLDSLMKRKHEADWKIWHFRLFNVIRPEGSTGLNYGSYTRHELEKMHLWHSEDLAMIFLPSVPDVKVRLRALNLNMLLGMPEFERDRTRGIVPYLALIGHKYKPKLVLMTVGDLPRFGEDSFFDFPIVILSSRVFDANGPEAWMAFSGDNVTVYQVVLEVGDQRAERDAKIHALQAQLGLPFPNCIPCFILYFTELWPGGTSKEIPQCDIIVVRNAFPGVPVFGGRAGRFMGNQKLPILETFSTEDSRSLRLRPTPTIVTVVCFAKLH